MNIDLENVNIDSKKVNIGLEKVNIGVKKASIQDMLTAKTASRVQQLRETLAGQSVFGRSDVQRILELKPTRSSILLREMVEFGIIEPVSGYGKGKYRFR